MSLLLTNGYLPMVSEWDIYHNFKPSTFQKIFWLFWPTRTSNKWNMYKNLKRTDCVD